MKKKILTDDLENSKLYDKEYYNKLYYNWYYHYRTKQKTKKECIKFLGKVCLKND